MTQITIAEWLSATHKTELPATHELDCELASTLDNPQYTDKIRNDFLTSLWGRIICTSSQYVAIGYNGNGDWMRITCSDLRTAQSHITRNMTERMFLRHIDRQARLAQAEAKALQADK